VLPQRVSGNHVSIVRRPVSDPDPAVLFDHALESDRLARRRVKQRLPLIGGCPLRPGDEILAPRLRSVRSATSGHQAVDESLLLIRGDRFHCAPVNNLPLNAAPEDFLGIATWASNPAGEPLA